MMLASLTKFSNFAFLVVYLILGGFVFKYIERDDEVEIRKLLVVLYENMTRDAECVNLDTVDELITLTLTAQKYGIREWGNLTTSTQWNYFGSLFFSLVLVSTVGYGNMAPATGLGQLACVVYAFFGIPIFLNAMSQFSTQAKRFICRLEDRLLIKRRRFLVSSLIMLFIFCLVCVAPCFLFVKHEEWSFAEAMYFSFITLSTTGFGDYVAGRQTLYVSSYRLFLVFWMLIGLMYVAVVIAYVQLIIEWLLEKVEAKIFFHGRIAPFYNEQVRRKCSNSTQTGETAQISVTKT